ncbi:MAG: hypothetical protein COA44_11375 [Arcobacter sp.]|nr:MAG: hypothetical protein COA44_11375 [Arcobacter sp.]
MFSTASANVDFYLKMAKDKDLSQSRYWHILLHMPQDQSEIDDKAFFLSPNGQTNAKEELEATITALYNETKFDDNATACKFPARKWWLSKELNLQDLPSVKCKGFDTLMKKVDPQSASLIFPSAYINSPASMFGHTFIRIDSSYKSKMLSYAINYAANANTETENGLVFAIKGLIGGYYGTYSLLPYYEKIKEYRDSEERDIWEYDLDLNPQELQQMMRHTWEIHDTYSWYYFFTENCSYNMLWLIESAKPSVHLREYFNFQVIPPETIHVAVKEGLITTRHYRPARRSKLLAYEKHLSQDEIQKVFDLTNNKENIQVFLDDERYDIQSKRFILEATAEFIEYDFLAGDISPDTYRQRLHHILGARSSLGKGERIVISQPDDPMLGHRALRTRFQGGVRDGKGIGFIGIRPANHDITDSDVGFLRGTQIEFFNFLFSYGDEAFNVEEAGLINIVSLSPRTKFFKPISWRLNTGWDRKYLTESTKFTSNMSGGLTWANELGYAYILVDALFYTDKDLTAGIGGVGGLVAYEGRNFKTNMEVTQRIYDTGNDQLLFSVSQHYRSSQNISFSLSYDYIEKYEEDWDTIKFTFDYFF